MWINLQTTLGTVVAAKEIITAMMNPKDLKEFIHEAKMLTQMNHPHVLRVLGFCTVLAEDSTDDMEHKYIVTEFAPHGSLENAIENAIAVVELNKQILLDEAKANNFPQHLKELEAANKIMLPLRRKLENVQQSHGETKTALSEAQAASQWSAMEPLVSKMKSITETMQEIEIKYKKATTRVEAAAKKVDSDKKANSSELQPMPFTKIQALEWAVQIASGMTFCHGRGFVHRDLKPQNILLNKSNDAVVADLGTVRNTGSGKNPDGSSSLSEEEENEKFEAIKRQMTEGESGVTVLLKTINNEAMTNLTGTPMYMSPEQYRFTYSYPVDVYAYGLMMIRLFTLKLPYPSKVCTMKQLMDDGRAGILVPIKVKKRDVPDPIVLKVINDCLQKYPKQRPTFKEIEQKLSQALKNCQTMKNNETKTANGYLTALDGTMFTLPSNKGETKEQKIITVADV